MSLTDPQINRYWREWRAVCAVQGWKQSDNARRYAVHKVAGCPQSMKDFGNRDFDRYLAETAALRNQVDIRDREREHVEIAIERMAAAIGEIEQKRPDDYIGGIVRDMNDRESWQDLPLDPIEDQIQRGATRPRGDLENLKRTLNNRLSALLTDIKKGKRECPSGRDWWAACANNAVIASIISGMVCIRVRGGYQEISHARYAELQERRKLTPAPAAPREPKTPRPAMRETSSALATATGHVVDDDNIPF